MTKAEVNRISNQMVQWIKRKMKRDHGLDIEWCKVWERHRSGRLHLNLLVSPWRYIPQQLLARKWHAFGGGSNTWVKRVGRGSGVVARASRYKCGLYFGKYDQMVYTGKGITYSKGWPKLKELHSKRLGLIEWAYISNVSEEGILQYYNIEMGYYREYGRGEFGGVEPEKCDCFEFRPTAQQIAHRMMEAFRRSKPTGFL